MLGQPIDWYIRRPLCPACKKDTLKSVDFKEKARTKCRVCFCDGLHYPHHKGTEPWCEHAKVGPDDREYRERYR